jgi:hypothetical protein
MEERDTDPGAGRGAIDSGGREAARGARGEGEAPLDPCDSARVAETYRLESRDEACDDGIR